MKIIRRKEQRRIMDALHYIAYYSHDSFLKGYIRVFLRQIADYACEKKDMEYLQEIFRNIDEMDEHGEKLFESVKRLAAKNRKYLDEKKKENGNGE